VFAEGACPATGVGEYWYPFGAAEAGTGVGWANCGPDG
jgi:hypothetical protein